MMVRRSDGMTPPPPPAAPYGLPTPGSSSPCPPTSSSPARAASSRPSGPCTPQKETSRSRKKSKRSGKSQPTRTSPRLQVKGTVTPSKAAPFFHRRVRSKAPSSEASSSKRAGAASSSSVQSAAQTRQSSPSSTTARIKRMRFSIPSPPSSPIIRAKGAASMLSESESDDEMESGEQGMGGGYYAFMSDAESMFDDEEQSIPRPGLLALTPTLRPFATTNDPIAALRGMRTFGYGGVSRLGAVRQLAMPRPSPTLSGARISSTDYLETFVSRHKADVWGVPMRSSPHELESQMTEDQEPRGVGLVDAKEAPFHGSASQVLCCEYAHASRSFDPVPQAQWLAVGDAAGQITLLNTLQDPTAEEFTAHPQWQISDSFRTIFEVSWRFDDRILAVGSADFSISLWDVATQSQVTSFSSGFGSPRCITWDPHGGGNMFTSAGRDGAIHMYDMRLGTREPCTSIEAAYGGKAKSRSSKIRGEQPRSITALQYHPHRPNALFSAGSVDGVVRLWDLRASVRAQNAAIDEEGKKFAQPLAELDLNVSSDAPEASSKASSRKQKLVRPRHAEEASEDVSLRMGHNGRPHGISSIVSSGVSSLLFAACTDGHVYPVPLGNFDEALAPTSFGTLPSLYHPRQARNTLFTRLAMHGDERTLAVGCATGSVVLWDTAGVGAAISGYEGATGHEAEDDLERLKHLRRPAVLSTAHEAEINDLSWAHSASGPTLATVSDDSTIRTWRPDAAATSAMRAARASESMMED